MTVGAPKPTKDIVLDLFDFVWMQLSARLEGLDDHEYLWAPVADVWTVEPEGDRVVVTGRGPAPGDPPFTTIAWRTWHIASDCLDGYSSHLFGTTGASVTGDAWHLRAQPAVADLTAAFEQFRARLGAMSDSDMWAPIGESFGPFGESSHHELVLHAVHEMTHHTGEIGTIRDLYRQLEAERSLL